MKHLILSSFSSGVIFSRKYNYYYRNNNNICIHTLKKNLMKEYTYIFHWKEPFLLCVIIYENHFDYLIKMFISFDFDADERLKVTKEQKSPKNSKTFFD
jgi:hypothetical protein